MSAPTLSIVIPAHNEEESLPVLLDEIASLDLDRCILEEVIVVNDGSTDGTVESLASQRSRFAWLDVISFEERRGQTAALAVGFEAARGELVATMDADLQNDPADIPNLVSVLMDSGADMVAGTRQRRRDGLWKRVQSRIGNSVRDWITGDHVTDAGCTLRVSTRTVVVGLLKFDGAHRFIPTLVRARGGRVVEEPVRHRPRRFGASKYGAWNRAVNGLVDCFTVRRLRSTDREL